MSRRRPALASTKAEATIVLEKSLRERDLHHEQRYQEVILQTAANVARLEKEVAAADASTFTGDVDGGDNPAGYPLDVVQTAREEVEALGERDEENVACAEYSEGQMPQDTEDLARLLAQRDEFKHRVVLTESTPVG